VGGVFVVAALVGVLVMVLPSPKPRRVEATESGEAQVYTPPKTIRLTRAMRREVDRTVDEFVRTAVLRRNVARAWQLSAPDLRLGYTRAEWVKGDLPVFPFPADPKRTAWDVDYADEVEVALNVTLVPRKGVADPPEVFGVSLKPVGRAGSRHWLVSSWLARGAVSAPPPVLGSDGTETTQTEPAELTPEEREAVRRATEGQIDRVWWLVPAGLLALIVVGPLAYFGVRRLGRSLRS
jgi:hypothetical protein